MTELIVHSPCCCFLLNLWDCCTTWHLLPFRCRELKIDSMHSCVNTEGNVMPLQKKKEKGKTVCYAFRFHRGTRTNTSKQKTPTETERSVGACSLFTWLHRAVLMHLRVGSYICKHFCSNVFLLCPLWLLQERRHNEGGTTTVCTPEIHCHESLCRKRTH